MIPVTNAFNYFSYLAARTNEFYFVKGTLSRGFDSLVKNLIVAPAPINRC